MSSSASGSGSDSEEDIHTETLVAGRQRRANAGNRMATLLATEEPVETQGDEDDDLKLLFQEDAEEEDAAFDSPVEIVSDVDMGSSSDEDEGKGEDEDAGEKELQRQVREDKKRKRKALETFGASKKRKTVVTKTDSAVETTIVATAAPVLPRPKKKAERVSWLPIEDERSTRASSRKQTVLNKQIVHERMKESEKKRREVLKAMYAAAKRKEAAKGEALTQEDRLAEAARVEAKNAKTLTRWEAAEERRIEERRIRLAAMKNQGIQGSMIRVWSGPSKWVDGKCVGVGKKVLEVAKSEQKPHKQKTDLIIESRPISDAAVTPDQPSKPIGSAARLPAITLSAPEVLQSSKGSWASPAPDNTLQDHEDGPQAQADNTDTTVSAIPSEAQQVEIQSRTFVILDEDALDEPSIKNSILVKGRKSTIKVHGKQPEKDRCLITGMLAKYRDPKTGVPYANIAAFKHLRANQSSDNYTNGRWSTLLGQYVGSDMDAPAGVPERLKRNVSA